MFDIKNVSPIALFNDASEMRDNAQAVLNDIAAKTGMPIYTVDEIAVCVGSAGSLAFLTNRLAEGGFEHFYSVQEDPVLATQPWNGTGMTSYLASYEFLRWGGEPWRIEAMCATDSPLHPQDTTDNGFFVHASFKVEDPDDYLNAIMILDGDVAESVARCHSSYGAFSYHPWGEPDIDGRTIYLKPRYAWATADEFSKGSAMLACGHYRSPGTSHCIRPQCANYVARYV